MPMLSYRKILSAAVFIMAIFLLPPAVFSDTASPDALAVRVMANPKHYSPLVWYKNNNFKGAPQSLMVDGYEAVRDGRTVYVNAANLLDGTLWTNIYIISYNQNAESPTVDIFGQMLLHWKFNTNLNADQAQKDQIRRDVKRLSDMTAMNDLLDQYKAGHNGAYPDLKAGSYIAGASVSTWPSWRDTLSKFFSASLPVDPVNKLNDCTGYDSGTCWNPQTKEFKFNLNANSAGDANSVSRSAVYWYKDGVFYTSLETNKLCGDGQLDPGEDCDGSAGLAGWGCLSPGAKLSCPACARKCSDGSAPYLGKCGNGAMEGLEQCDNGASNTNTACTAPYGGSCAYCDTSCQSHTTAGVFCGDGVKNGAEECDGGSAACFTQSWGYKGVKQCMSNCKYNNCDTSEFCGDGIKNGTELCDGVDGISGNYTCQACRLYCDPARFHIDNQYSAPLCLSNVKDCTTFANAFNPGSTSKAEQTYISDIKDFGTCSAVACNDGYDLIKNTDSNGYNYNICKKCADGTHFNSATGACEQNVVANNITGGTCEKTWQPATNSYSDCLVKTCNNPYHKSFDNKSCTLETSVICDTATSVDHGAMMSTYYANPGQWGSCVITSTDPNYPYCFPGTSQQYPNQNVCVNACGSVNNDIRLSTQWNIVDKNNSIVPNCYGQNIIIKLQSATGSIFASTPSDNSGNSSISVKADQLISNGKCSFVALVDDSSGAVIGSGCPTGMTYTPGVASACFKLSDPSNPYGWNLRNMGVYKTADTANCFN